MQPALAPAPHMLRPSAQDSTTSTEQALREQLLSHVHDPSQSQQQSRPYAGATPDARGNSSPANHAHNIDPAIAGTGMMSHSPGESGGDDNSESKKAKRELSTSKRAAQNRAAQRAFRQRKEGHIKRLEEQVRDYAHLSENYKAVQAENYQLRDYIISLQSRLIESQGDFPPAPSNINLQQPPTVPHGLPGAPTAAGLVVGAPSAGGAANGNASTAPTAPMGGAAASQLQASAAKAVEGLKAENAAAGATDPTLSNAGTGKVSPTITSK